MSIDSAFATRTLTIQLQELLFLDEQRRAEALDALVGIDPDMTDQLRKILFDDQWDQFLEPDENSTGPILVRQLFDRLKAGEEPDPIPERLGPYRILSRLGVGGMGEVYLAEDQAPFERHVALKVLKTRHSWDGDRAKALLEQEIQSQAGLDHAYIPKIYSSGVLSDNRVYFAMELIRGVPITEYCDRFKLTLRERLHLVSKVCDALSHCHAMLRVHGDLKPSNILVTLPSDVSPGGEPRIIDFGIAQRLDTKRDRPSGTIQYMAPEQAERNGVASVSNDVYGIGAVLHHVLVGFPPVIADKPDDNFEYLKSRRLRPSEVLKEREDLAGIVEARQEKPKRFMKKLKQELDVLLLKALEPNPQKRYDGIQSLKRDISDFLSDRKITVVERYSPLLSLQKRWRRDRKGVTLQGLSVILFVSISCLLLWVLREQDKTKKALQDANHVAELYQRILNKPHPFESGPEVKFIDVVIEAEKLLNSLSPDRPDLQAKIRMTLGITYLQLSNHERSIEQLNLARDLLDDEDRDIPLVLLSLGKGYREIDLDKAIDLFQQSLNLSWSLGDIHMLISSMVNLSVAMSEQGDYQCAMYYAQEATDLLELQENSDMLDVVQAKVALGIAYSRSKRNTEAMLVLENALFLSDNYLGEHHPESYSVRISLSSCYYRLGFYQNAYEIADVSASYFKSLEWEHFNLARAHYLKALVYMRRGFYDDARLSAENALLIQQKLFGESAPDTLKSRALIASILGRLSDYQKAAERYESIVYTYLLNNKLESRDGLNALNNLGHQYNMVGEYGLALENLAVAFEKKKTIFGLADQSTLVTLASIGEVWESTSYLSEAERIYSEVLHEADRSLVQSPWLRGVIRYYLGRIHLKLGNYGSAECFLRDAKGLLNPNSSFQNKINIELERLQPFLDQSRPQISSFRQEALD